MCGIAGIVRLDGHPVEQQRLEAMTGTLRHRGPDGEGFWIAESVGLGHRRLSIIDLTTGDQPMCNEDDSVVTIFNGEIYNFLELRPILQGRGHTFRTSSDTEVLVHGYEEWGRGMLDRLNGMFAFAIYDARRERLFLARDRIGVKPLYYYQSESVFVFASELGGLMANGLVPRDIDQEALDLYLHYKYIPAPHTIYRDVRKLSPAEFLELDVNTGSAITGCYWDITASTAPDATKSLTEWMEELEALLADAVRIRLISDVPFGAFLSGGVDSGLTVAMMANRMSEPVSTFSIGLTGEEDELPYARRVAEQYHTQHEEFRVTAEGLTLIPRLCASFGEPFADASAIPTYYVSKIARSRVKMVLTGDGGDEMFAGYVSYPRITGFVPVDESPGDILGSVIASLSAGARLSHPSASGGSARHSSGASTPDELGWALRTIMRRGRSFLRYALAPWYKRHDILMGCFTLAERRALLGRGTSLSGADYLVRRHPFVGADSLVTAAQYIDVKSYLPDGVLVKVDRMSMVNSLEVRSPLLDYRIAELAFSMPTAIKLSEPLRDGSSGKYVLKELGSRYLGRDYVYRPKRGFGIPLERWLREDNGSYVKDTLLSGSSPIHDHLSRDVVRRVAQAHLDGTRDHGSRLWSLLMLDGWLRHVHDGTPGFSGGAS